MSLKIYLLGQFKLQADDKLIELPSRPAQSLLVYLALNAGISQRREKLACLLWPEATESNARGYLRQALWRLRKALDNALLPSADYLHISDISLTFDDHAHFWLDAHQLLLATDPLSLDELITTVSLYQGELLPGFYDEWVVLERDRLLSAYHQVMNQLLAGLIQACRWDEALKWSDHWVRLGHAPEPAFRAMMHAYAGSGDQGMVSATYQRCRESLNRELGLDPSPETQQLFEQILRGELYHPAPAPAPTTDSSPQLAAFLLDAEAHPVEQPIFVTRDQELTQLQGYLDKALGGRGRIAFITGEAGSGKTTLLQEYTRRAQIAQHDLVIASGICNAHTGIGDPYLPFREILELLTGDVEARWAAGAITRDHAIRLWNNLPIVAEALVEVGPDLVDTFVPGSGLIGRYKACVPNRTNWFTRLDELSKRRFPGVRVTVPGQIDLFEQYTRVLQLLSQHVSLVLVIDDLQWADLGSISLLFHLGRNLSGSRIMILGAYRPEEIAMGRDGERHPLDSVINEFQREFGDITVNIDQAENREFVNALVDSEPNRLGPSFREMLFRQTHGHPMFTIELLRGMQERGDLIQDQNGLWNEGKTLDWETLPARVEAVVAERISRLDSSLQAVLRVASVEGEIFTVEVVEQVLAKEDQGLLDLLSVELDRKHRLISAQSIQRIDGRLISNYRFRHILTQRYLYGRLNEVERVHLHEQIGTNLEALYNAHEAAIGEEIKTIAPQLARHFQEARIASKAINYLRQAGERAAYLSAYWEGITHLENGLAMLLTLPESPDRDEIELELQLALGIAWHGHEGAQAEETKIAFTRAHELCQQLGNTSNIGQVLGGLSTIYYVRAEYQRALELAEEALSYATQTEDPLLVALANWYPGILLFCLGEITTALDHLEKVIEFYRPEEHHYPFIGLRGSDAGLGALAYSACCLWCLGYPDQALQRSQEVLVLGSDLSHPFSLADVICFAGCFYNSLCRDAEALKDNAERLIQLAENIRLTGWIATGTRYRGEALYMLGNADEGIKQMQEGIAVMQSSGIQLFLPSTLGFIAEAQAKIGQFEDGLETLDEALDIVEQTNERIWEVEIHRLRAKLLLLMQGDQSAAEDSYHKAIEVARQQRAKSWELRASTGLARLWKSQGRVDEARELLEGIYAWFTEGFDTPDLKEAKSLLEEMS